MQRVWVLLRERDSADGADGTHALSAARALTWVVEFVPARAHRITVRGAGGGSDECRTPICAPG
jgi:hypothetical protein